MGDCAPCAIAAGQAPIFSDPFFSAIPFYSNPPIAPTTKRMRPAPRGAPHALARAQNAAATPLRRSRAGPRSTLADDCAAPPKKRPPPPRPRAAPPAAPCAPLVAQNVGGGRSAHGAARANETPLCYPLFKPPKCGRPSARRPQTSSIHIFGFAVAPPTSFGPPLTRNNTAVYTSFYTHTGAAAHTLRTLTGCHRPWRGCAHCAHCDTHAPTLAREGSRQQLPMRARSRLRACTRPSPAQTPDSVGNCLISHSLVDSYRWS